MGLHSDMKKVLVEQLRSKHGVHALGNATWFAGDPKRTARLVDYLTYFKGLFNEKPWTLNELTDNLANSMTLDKVSISIAVVDDKRNVPNLKAGEQAARVAASRTSDARKGLEVAKSYTLQEIQNELLACKPMDLRRLSESNAEVRRELWTSMHIELWNKLQAQFDKSVQDGTAEKYRLTRCFDYTMDACMLLQLFVATDDAHLNPDVQAVDNKALGEGEMRLFYWAHVIETKQISHAPNITIIDIDTTDSDVLAIYAFYHGQRSSLSTQLLWHTRNGNTSGQKAEKPVGGYKTGKSDAGSSPSGSSAAAAAAAAASAVTSKYFPEEGEEDDSSEKASLLAVGSKRKARDNAFHGINDDEPLVIDLGAAMEALCGPAIYDCHSTVLGQMMTLCGHDYLDTNDYAFMKGMTAIRNAYFAVLSARKQRRNPPKPSLDLFVAFIRELWKIVSCPDATVPDLRKHYSKLHVAAVAKYRKDLPDLMVKYRQKLASYEAAVASKKRAVKPREPQEPILRFPSDAVIQRCAAVWIFICDSYSNAHLGVLPSRGVEQIMRDEAGLYAALGSFAASASAAAAPASNDAGEFGIKIEEGDNAQVKTEQEEEEEEEEINVKLE
jgi:hypothetical protein